MRPRRPERSHSAELRSGAHFRRATTGLTTFPYTSNVVRSVRNSGLVDPPQPDPSCGIIGDVECLCRSEITARSDVSLPPLGAVLSITASVLRYAWLGSHLTWVVVERIEADQTSSVTPSRREWAVFGLAVAIGLAIVALKLYSEFGAT